jgi:hypothetical protein
MSGFSCFTCHVPIIDEYYRHKDTGRVLCVACGDASAVRCTVCAKSLDGLEQAVDVFTGQVLCPRARCVVGAAPPPPKHPAHGHRPATARCLGVGRGGGGAASGGAVVGVGSAQCRFCGYWLSRARRRDCSTCAAEAVTCPSDLDALWQHVLTVLGTVLGTDGDGDGDVVVAGALASLRSASVRLLSLEARAAPAASCVPMPLACCGSESSGPGRLGLTVLAPGTASGVRQVPGS